MVDPRPRLASRSLFWSGDRSMTLLLALLVVLIFVVPVASRFEAIDRIVVDVGITLVLIVGIVASLDRHARNVLLAAALVALAIRWMPHAVPALASPLLREASSFATFLLLAGIVAIKVFEAGGVTMDRVMGAVVLYLLLGLCWAMVYELVALQDPGAFAGAERGDGHQRWVYFSFVTLTTVGYGDITAVSPVARSLAILEALVGQLYPAILLGRLVSLVQGGGTAR